MPALLTPPRIRGEEILDRDGIDPRVVTRAIGDVAKANALFGGLRAVLAELEAIETLPPKASLLDVGTGVGDIPQAATAALAKRGIELTTFGLDASEPLAKVSSERLDAVVCAEAPELPFASRSVDVVMCSQFLHHLLPDEASTLIREMNRVATLRVIVSDIRRSWLAAAGLWIASFPLRFHPISRHDGVVSVMRGFTRDELTQMVSGAIGIEPRTAHRRGFRVTASWTPTG
jgi:ubiquinone/menaquinone biosynthesis C-methylase UbiE